MVREQVGPWIHRRKRRKDGTQGGQKFTGVLVQVSVVFNGVHLLAISKEHTGLIAGAGAYFENLVAGLDFQFSD